MARITVEDCIDKFPSRFELVLVASNRARRLHSGDDATVEIDNDKNTVIALREIAEETLTTEELKNDLIEQYQTNTFTEDEDLDEIEDKTEDVSNDQVVDMNESEKPLASSNETEQSDLIENQVTAETSDNFFTENSDEPTDNKTTEDL